MRVHKIFIVKKGSQIIQQLFERACVSGDNVADLISLNNLLGGCRSGCGHCVPVASPIQ